MVGRTKSLFYSKPVREQKTLKSHIVCHLHRCQVCGRGYLWRCVPMRLTVPRSMMKQSPLLKLSQLRGTSVALTTLRPFTCNSLSAVRSLVRTWFSPEATPPAWSRGGKHNTKQRGETMTQTQQAQGKNAQARPGRRRHGRAGGTWNEQRELLVKSTGESVASLSPIIKI